MEEREQAVRGRAERLRAEIASLSAELAAVEEMLARLEITRETVLSLLASDDSSSATPVASPTDPVVEPGRAGVSVPLSARPAAAAADGPAGVSVVYRQVVEVFTVAGRPLRAKQVCQVLGVGTESRHVEGMRSKLKRLVERGVLAEPEPGMFVMADVAGVAGVAGPVTAGKEDQ